jgi:ribosomal protein S18 acetylase RimI-like enzyme
MILRAALPEDRPALVAFMAALQDFEHEIEPNRTPGAEMAGKHLAGLEAWAAEHPGGGVLVAEIGGALAGFIIFGVTEEFGELVPPETRLLGQISDLWVAPTARGRGIASALVDAAEARFREAGLKRVEISALAGNTQAQRLYESLGYGPYHVTLAKGL